MWVLAGLTAAVLFVVRTLKGRRSAMSTAGVAGRPRLVPPILLLAALTVAGCQTIVLIALPVLSRQLGVSAVTATWLLTGFMLASAVAAPIAGRLGDQHGHRRVLLVSLSTLVAGSLLAAVSDQAGWFPGLLTGRILQGLSGGAFPAAFGLARRFAPPERLGGLIAALSAAFGIGGALGLVIAGPIVTSLGTSWLFWLGAGLGAVALGGAALLPTDRPHLASPGRRPDLVGAVLLSATVVALLLGISQGRNWGWTSPASVTTFITCLACAAALIAVLRRTPTPILDLALLRQPTLLGANIATVVISVGMFAAVTLVPQYAQTPVHTGYGFGYSAARTGLLLLPTALLMVLSTPLAARLGRGTSGRVTFQLGAALAVVGLCGLGLAHDRAWQIYLDNAILGAAYGLAFASLGTVVVNAVTPDQTGAATGLNTILRTIGGALGAQLAAVIVTSSTPPTENGYTTAFLTSAAVAALAFLIAFTIPATRRWIRPATSRPAGTVES